MRFGDPVIPPPASEASEATYSRLTETVKTRVVEMWREMRGELPTSDAKAAD
jgi:hypothetical protein